MSELVTSFVRVAAEWTASHALDVLAIGPHLAVVHRVDAGVDYFYVFDADALQPRFQAAGETVVADLLGLKALAATPVVVAASTPVTGEAVVVRGGAIVGVLRPAATALRAPGSAVTPPLGVPTVCGLSAKLASQILVDGDATLTVAVTRQAGAGTGDHVDLAITVCGPLSIVGDGHATIAVGGSQTFQIRGTGSGAGVVDVHAFQHGAHIAAVEVTSQVVTTLGTPTTNVGTAALQVSPDAPDLSIIIIESRAERSYRMLVTSSDGAMNFAPYGPIQLADDVEQFFATFFSDIEKILMSSDDWQTKAVDLGVRGTYLMERIVPQGLRELLWSLRKNITSIQIQSEEPWVPWELCKLFATEDNKTVEGGFLTEEFVVTRWFLGVAQSTVLSLSSIGLVVPANVDLAAAAAEANFIRGLHSPPDRTVTDVVAQTVALRNALAGASYDGFHFVGHGQANTGNADRSSLFLEGARKFTPEDLCGAVANLRAKRPIVVLNACQVGRSGGSTLGGMAGWPQAFIRAGAGVFVGPYWSVGDGSSSRFAEAFYKALLDDRVSVGEAAHRARVAVRQANDPTWLSYVVYAHPEAKLS